jgi:hypothetical protein
MAVASDTREATANVVRELMHVGTFNDPALRLTPLWLLTILLRYLEQLENLSPPPTVEFPPPPEGGRMDPWTSTPQDALPAATPYPVHEQVAHVARVCERVLLACTGAKPWPPKTRRDERINAQLLAPASPPPPPPDLTPAGRSYRFARPTHATAPFEPAVFAAAFQVLNPLTNELMEVSYPTA